MTYHAMIVTTWKRSISYEHNQEGEEAMRNGHARWLRKRYLLQAAVGSFFCLLATASASEPTLQEALDFIERKTEGMCQTSVVVKDNGKVNEINRVGDYTITLLDDDTILVKAQHVFITILDQDRQKGSSDRYRTLVFRTNLADLSTQVETRAGIGNQPHSSIIVECTEKNCIEIQVTNKEISSDIIWEGKRMQATRRSDGDDEKGLYSSAVLFQICSPDAAERVAKALTYAIKLSGGKDELF